MWNLWHGRLCPTALFYFNQHCLAKPPESWHSKGVGKVSQYFWPFSLVRNHLKRKMLITGCMQSEKIWKIWKSQGEMNKVAQVKEIHFHINKFLDFLGDHAPGPLKILGPITKCYAVSRECH